MKKKNENLKCNNEKKLKHTSTPRYRLKMYSNNEKKLKQKLKATTIVLCSNNEKKLKHCTSIITILFSLSNNEKKLKLLYLYKGKCMQTCNNEKKLKPGNSILHSSHLS